MSKLDELAIAAELAPQFEGASAEIAVHLSQHPEARIYESRQNVVDLLEMINEDDKEKVRRHYQWRGIHCPAAVAGDIVILPVSETTKPEGYAKLQRLRELAAWMERNTGIKFVVVDEEYKRIHNFPVVTSPYYTGSIQEAAYVGADPQEVRALKHKALFGEMVVSVNTHQIFVPQVEVGPERLLETIKAKLNSVIAMYSQAASLAAPVDKALIEAYIPGVVVRAVSADGGFGSFFLEYDRGQIFLKYGKETHAFPGWSELEDFFVENNVILRDNYVVSRKVDVRDDQSPSNGFYVRADGREVVAMPMTYQLMKYGSCVGGGSRTAVNGEFEKLRQLYEKQIHEVARKLFSRYVTSAKVQRFAHLGLDTIVSDVKEQALKRAIEQNPELHAAYGGEVVDIALVECNPRYTSLSLSAWAVIQVIAQVRQINLRDEEQMFKLLLEVYGLPNENNEAGGFFVWDYLKMPEGITGENGLLDYIDQFNSYYRTHYGIFLVPRIAVNQEKGEYISSLVMGMEPTKNSLAHEVFRELQNRITERGIDFTLLNRK